MKIREIREKMVAYFNSASRAELLSLASVMVVCLGLIDYVTGYEISFSIFYMVPVILVSWFAGKWPSLFISALCALTWFFADQHAGHTYSASVIPVWNAMVRFGFFLIGAFSLASLRNSLEREKTLARTDPLTGVANGRYFGERLRIEIDRALRFHHPLTVAYMDVDDFKQINDSFGHSTGDELLSVVAGTMKKNVRSIDLIARLGGDEFAILMPETGPEQAQPAMHKVRKCLLDGVMQKKWPVTFSMGVVTCDKPECSSDEMIKMADTLMYSAKNQGKNMIVFESRTKRTVTETRG